MRRTIAGLQIVDNWQSTEDTGEIKFKKYETVPLRCINKPVIVKGTVEDQTHRERAMAKLKRIIVRSAAVAAIAFLPLAPAMAGGHGFVHPWGLGRGLFGAAVALATLPLAIASAVVSSIPVPAAAPAPYPAPGYAGGYGYAPAPYPAPPAYYAPRPAYYPAPRAYYAPRPYYAPYAGYPGRGYYRSGGSAYPHR
jgi:hypothetical protein